MFTLKDYRREIAPSLDDDFQRRMLDSFAASYRGSRESVFAGKDVKAAIADVAARKDDAIRRRDELFARFCEQAEKLGITVHRAADAAQACALVADIARQNGCRKIVKSKSMTTEEIRLNPALRAAGLEVVETDLGEWILQLRGEGPSHMVMPAIHLSRGQVARTFAAQTDGGASSGVNAAAADSDAMTNPAVDPDIEPDIEPAIDPDDITSLVRLARREMRRHFAEADMGVSGANFALASNGAIGLVTNEGNARLVTTLPRVHVALCGWDKLVESADDALALLNILPRNATGQHLTSYISWVRGATGDGRSMHVIFLDNGRTALARDPLFSQVLRCVRCGACANVCPVYRLVGGHRLGEVYIGAIGLILTWFFHDRERAKALIQNCTNCQACKEVCGAGIDLPRLIEALRNRAANEAPSLPMAALSGVLKRRKVFHALLRTAARVQGPFTEHTPFVRRWPGLLAHFAPQLIKDHAFRALPALADESFRSRWPDRKPSVARPRYRIALFGGCLQDFVYPEQLDAALAVFAHCGVEVDFPLDQTCCGLPLIMLGKPMEASDVARANLRAFAGDRYDAIVTLCASCASHLKHGYVNLLGREAEAFSARITDFSSFIHGVWLAPDAEPAAYSTSPVEHSAQLPTPTEPASLPVPTGRKATYHAACHLCRGLGVHNAPRALLRAAASYLPSAEEETCCGFGGTYTTKFPEISAELLARKLDNAEATGADTLVADCPGCILHLRGGAEKRQSPLRVLHMAELLMQSLPKK